MANPYQMRRKRSNPRFLVIKIWLLINGVISAFFVVGMLGLGIYEGFTTGFADGLTVIQVERDLSEEEKKGLDLTGLIDTEIKGDYKTEISWLSGFIVPFFSGGLYEISWIFMLFNFTIYYLLYRVLHDITSIKTFVAKNVQRIYLIGFVYLTWLVITVLRSLWLQGLVEEWDPRYRLDIDPQAHFFHLGVVVLIIGYIYRTGVALQKEKELII